MVRSRHGAVKGLRARSAAPAPGFRRSGPPSASSCPRGGGGCLTFSQIASRFAPPGLPPAAFSCKKSSRTHNSRQPHQVGFLGRFPRFFPENACLSSDFRSLRKRLMPLAGEPQQEPQVDRPVWLWHGGPNGVNKPGGRPMRPFPEKTDSPSVPVSEAPAAPQGS